MARALEVIPISGVELPRFVAAARADAFSVLPSLLPGLSEQGDYIRTHGKRLVSGLTTDPATPLFDRATWRRHRDRAALAPVGFLHAEIADRLLDRLDLIGGEYPLVLDLGARDGSLSRALAARPGTARVVAAEPSRALVAAAPVPRIVADPELSPFAECSFDLMASCLALHWCADLPGALIQLRRALKPGGLLLAALFGGATLLELRTALFNAELEIDGGVSPRVSPTVELGDAAALLQRAGFTRPVADADAITVAYPDALALMRDLRGMGETNALAARRRNFTRRATLARCAALYTERFADPDGRVRATFEVLFLAGRAPHPDDAKPRPGPRRRIV